LISFYTTWRLVYAVFVLSFSRQNTHVLHICTLYRNDAAWDECAWIVAFSTNSTSRRIYHSYSLCCQLLSLNWNCWNPYLVFWFRPILDVTTGLRVFKVEHAVLVRVYILLTTECPFILYETGCKWKCKSSIWPSLHYCYKCGRKYETNKLY
jgi:hypothetical protein